MVRNEFVRGIAAGLFIGIGCVVFLACDNKYLGAFLFSLGLFAVLTTNSNLYTGKVGFVLDRPPMYTAMLIPIWIGNFIGAGLVGFIMNITRIAPQIKEKARALVDAKISDDPVSILALSVFCGVLMYLAAFNFDRFSDGGHSTMQLASVVLPVAVFIIAGFEHCVANMCYFVLAEEFTVQGLLYILLMTLGNTVGGILIPILIILSGPIHNYVVYKRVDLNDPNYEEKLTEMIEQIKKVKEEEENKEDE